MPIPLVGFRQWHDERPGLPRQRRAVYRPGPANAP